MTPERRAEIEARVDRAVRRGELSRARADLVALRSAFPDDDRLRSRLEAFEASVLPGELGPLRPAPPEPAAEPPPVHEPPEVRAERLVQEGDLPGALLAYRQAVAEHPDNLLFRERLAELFEWVRQEAPRAPDPRRPESTGEAPEGAGCATSAAPPDPGNDPVARLEQLLERLQSRRRTA